MNSEISLLSHLAGATPAAAASGYGREAVFVAAPRALGGSFVLGITLCKSHSEVAYYVRRFHFLPAPQASFQRSLRAW